MKPLLSKSLLILLIGVAFFQITFGLKLMNWDMMDITFPWRNFIGACLQEGVLPTWNPFITLGFPQQADPQTWYPISALISLPFGYNLYALHFEFILHLIIAGLGFRYLLKSFEIKNQIALLLFPLAYVCSGFFVGNAQFMGWIVSAAWIPIIIASTLLFFQKPQWKLLLQLVLSLFMLLTGGYPGLFIITGYVVMIIAFYYLWKNYGAKLREIPWIKLMTGIVIFLCLSSVVLYCSFEIRSHIYRDQLTVDRTLFGSLSTESFISLMYPFGTVNQTSELGNVDVSIINSYFGIFSLAFIVLAFFQRNKKAILLFIAALVFFMIALGNDLPLRRLLYYLPFWNTFRFPTIFRLFGIMFSLVAAAHVFDQINLQRDRKKIIGIFTSIALLQLITIIGVSSLGETWWLVTKKNLKYFITESTIAQRVAAQAFIVAVLYTLLAVIVFVKRKSNYLIWITPLLVIEILLFTQMNGAKTVYNMDSSFKETQAAISELPQGFPTPSLNDSLVNSQDNALKAPPSLWRNINMLYKKPTFYGYTPYYLDSTSVLENDPALQALIATPFLYFLQKGNDQQIAITAFSPNKITCNISGSEANKLVLTQNNYPGWTVFIDGTPTPHHTIHHTMIAVDTPAGNHNVTFEFSNKAITLLFWLSLSAFIAVLAVYFYL
jgi:hypothetical protein